MLTFEEVVRRAKDAKKPISFEIEKTNLDEGIPADPCNCPMTLGAKARFPSIVAVHTLRTITYVEYKNGRCLRYQPSATGQAVVLLTDALNGTLTLRNGHTLPVKLLPPRNAISQSWLRSKARNVIVKRSAQKRKGKPRRSYAYSKAMVLAGVRHGRWDRSKFKK